MPSVISSRLFYYVLSCHLKTNLVIGSLLLTSSMSYLSITTCYFSFVRVWSSTFPLWNSALIDTCYFESLMTSADSRNFDIFRINRLIFIGFVSCLYLYCWENFYLELSGFLVSSSLKMFISKKDWNKKLNYYQFQYFWIYYAETGKKTEV